MNGDEFTALAKLIYGPHRGWQTRAGADMEIHPSTINKWIAGERIPKLAQLAIQYIRLRRQVVGTRGRLLPQPGLFVEGVAEIEGVVPDPPILAPPARVRTALTRRPCSKWP